MWDQLISLDQTILLAINHCHSPYWDDVMSVISGKLTWAFFYISILIGLYKAYPKDFVWIVVGLLLSIVLADQLSSGLLKPLVARWRPSRDPILSEFVHIVHGYTGGKYGFVSSHAANVFAASLFTIPLFRNKLYSMMMLLWCLLVCYSRMYLGVHYPLDIIGGAFIGSFSGFLSFWIINKLKKGKNVSHTFSQVLVPFVVLLVTLVTVALFSQYLLFLA